MFNLIPYVLYVSAFPTIILLGLLVSDDSGAKSRFFSQHIDSQLFRNYHLQI